MDVDDETSGALGDMDDLEQYAFDNESCGICRDIVINRGVLDCCQHWFCYTCIDNWAAITNRCPLCKSEFQHITCTPVYDTTGANNEDEYSLASCDDDWYVQGETNALSFPSYYIDAEAVICLDDGDCMIRSGLVAAEDDSTVDTSIACDSCDKWYHAICVGFNPEMASEDSWLCPRCVSTEVKHNTDVAMKQSFSGDCVIGSDRTTSASSFSGRVSVSIADEGETALVVSMVGIHSEIGNSLSEASLSLKTEQEASNCNPHPSYSKDNLSRDATADGNVLRKTDGNVLRKTDGMVSSEQTKRSQEYSPIRESATDIFSSEQGNTSNEWLEAPQHVPSDSSLHSRKGAVNTEEENAVCRYNNDISSATKSPQLPSPRMLARKTSQSAEIDMIVTDVAQQIIGAQNTQLPPMHDGHDSSGMEEVKGMESGNEIRHPAKKAKLGVPDQEMHLVRNSSVSSTDCHASSSAAKTIVSDISEFAPQDKSVPDIMSIVEGDDYKRDPGRELAKPVGRRAQDKPGLRVKKIFRKDEGKASSAVVQKLQQEIREVVRDSGISILEKDNAFDEKLLTAFRAAIGKSVDGPAKRTNPSLIRTRRSLLQKGKIRENLTKKLYGASMRRRRSAWHRDWEVEFWKYRCSPGINPEKIDTLQSVLQLLKKSSDSAMDKESGKAKKGESNSSILSRVYLADASVVPRKDDIKPLSSLTGSSPLDQKSQTNDNREPNKLAPGTERIKINSTNSTGKIFSSILNKEASSRRENKNSQGAQIQPNQSAGDIKDDKRKWALEVLARKTASSVTSKDQTEGTDDLKGRYPLLAQLPLDLRPQLTADRHNKIPISARKVQLYRIAEHYLQKANLDVIRRCADTELAVADAVNVEKDIYERSNSKSVYVNLCSQATRQPAKEKSENDTSTLTTSTELCSDPISQQVTTVNTNIGDSNVDETLSREGISDPPSSSEQTEKSGLGSDLVLQQTLNEHTVVFSSVEEALKKAGLFDSPPNSPDRKATTIEGESNLRCIIGVDTEPGESLQSTSYLSAPIDLDKANCQDPDMSCQQTKCNSEEHQKLMPTKETTDAITFSVNLVEIDRCSVRCEKSSGPDKETVDNTSVPDKGNECIVESKGMDVEARNLHDQSCHVNHLLKEGNKPNNLDSNKENHSSGSSALNTKHSKGDKSTHQKSGDLSKKSKVDPANNNTSDSSSSIYKKVELFVKENIRPLCKSGVITVEQYRWAVAKTVDKVMKHHSGAKSVNFLIKEGDKVKKLALQYVEAAQQTIN